MSIRVLILLGMVIGTLGSAIERNDTIGDVSNTTENIVHEENVTVGRRMMDVEEIPQSGNIESNLTNNTDGIVEKLSIPDSTFNNSIIGETSTPIGNIQNNSKVGDELKHNSNKTVEAFPLNNGSSNNSNNIEVSTPMDVNNSKLDIKPKNIFLILSEGTDDESTWKTLKDNYSFAVEGFFQNCESHKKSDEPSKIALTDDVNCNCHKQLNYVINDLMVYARSIKGMHAAIVSQSNLTTPAARGFDNLAHHHHHHHKSKLIGNIDNVAISNPIRKYQSQLSDHSLSLYIDNQSESSMPTKMESTPTKNHSPIQHYANINRDGLWDYINMMTKIRWDFFRDIFDSIHKSTIFDRIRETYSRRHSLHFPTQQSPTIIDVFTNTLMNVQAIPNESGFLMVIVTPHIELPGIYKIIHNQPTAKDNLVIISGLDETDNKKLIPYLATGLGSNKFNNVQSICNLSSTIKLVLGNCQGVCEDEDFVPISIPLESLVPKIRVARSDEEDTPMEEEKPGEKEGSESEPSQDDPDDGADDDVDDRPKSSGISFHCKNDSLALTISIVLSICTACILHSYE